MQKNTVKVRLIAYLQNKYSYIVTYVFFEHQTYTQKNYQRPKLILYAPQKDSKFL